FPRFAATRSGARSVYGRHALRCTSRRNGNKQAPSLLRVFLHAPSWATLIGPPPPGSILIHPLILVDRLVQPRHLLGRNNPRRVLLIARLKPDHLLVVRVHFEERSLERRLPVLEADEAV